MTTTDHLTIHMPPPSTRIGKALLILTDSEALCHDTEIQGSYMVLTAYNPSDGQVALWQLCLAIAGQQTSVDFHAVLNTDPVTYAAVVKALAAFGGFPMMPEQAA